MGLNWTRVEVNQLSCTGFKLYAYIYMDSVASIYLNIPLVIKAKPSNTAYQDYLHDLKDLFFKIWLKYIIIE